MIVGVGHYSDPQIPAVTTSVHGATAFADWSLNTFHHLDRPLGGVAMLLSPPPGMGRWTPKDQGPSGRVRTATRLGLGRGEELPLEAATCANIAQAFADLMARAGTSPENAVVFYFAGHGVWKVNPFALPEDAVLATRRHGFGNLIDPRRTMASMVNTPPETQVFFIETCQEILPK